MELAATLQAGVSHVGLHFWKKRRPLVETMAEIAEFVLPEFHLAGKVGFGTAPLGNMFRDIPEQEAPDTVEAARQNGIRYFWNN
ncbi:hypothetical protein [Collimonas fungivorans]|uniref:hypothetical protein n=1 Tax=Collimonas fungivorans TaxID=158899 RepID=UPI0003162F06